MLRLKQYHSECMVNYVCIVSSTVNDESYIEENFCGFALHMFYFIQVYKISRENFHGLLRIHENHETFLLHNFCRLRYLLIIAKQRQNPINEYKYVNKS